MRYWGLASLIRWRTKGLVSFPDPEGSGLELYQSHSARAYEMPASSNGYDVRLLSMQSEGCGFESRRGFWFYFLKHVRKRIQDVQKLLLIVTVELIEIDNIGMLRIFHKTSLRLVFPVPRSRG